MIVEVLWPGGADDQRVDRRIAEKPEIVELNRRELPCRQHTSMVSEAETDGRDINRVRTLKKRMARGLVVHTAGIGHFLRGHVEVAALVSRRDDEHAHVMFAGGLDCELVAVKPAE